jgi:hypothetical protein
VYIETISHGAVDRGLPAVIGIGREDAIRALRIAAAQPPDNPAIALGVWHDADGIRAERRFGRFGFAIEGRQAVVDAVETELSHLDDAGKLALKRWLRHGIDSEPLAVVIYDPV